jgi:hypothetical protein
MIIVPNPFPDIGMISISEPQEGTDGYKVYWVDVDSLPTIFKMNAMKDWEPTNHTAFINEELSSFISELIKESYFQ